MNDKMCGFRKVFKGSWGLTAIQKKIGMTPLKWIRSVISWSKVGQRLVKCWSNLGQKLSTGYTNIFSNRQKQVVLHS